MSDRDIAKTESECMGCGKAASSIRRGLCQACYQSAYRRVSKGKVTWDELEQAGLVLRSDKGRNRKQKNAWAEKADEVLAATGDSIDSK